MLHGTVKLDQPQKDYDHQRLFFGDRKVQMDLARRGALVAKLSEQMENDISRVEEQPDLEDALELLVAARWAEQDGSNGGYDGRVSEWQTRLRAVLGRDEFGLTPEMLSERVARILGDDFPERSTVQASSPDNSRPILPARLSSEDTLESAVSLAGDGVGHRNGSPLSDNRDERVTLDRTADTVAPTEPPSPVSTGDAHLDRIIKGWPKLPAHVRATIMMLVGAAESSRTGGET